ncbi:MAG: hypothetical protein V1772_04885 [Chloroflexota bacterium]
MGIIDTISAGFSLLARRAWLALVPALLDLFLWLGPKLSIAPLLESTIQMLRGTMDTLAAGGGLDPNLADMMNSTTSMLRDTVGQTNLLSLLAWGRLGVPSIAGLRPIAPASDVVIEIGGYGQVLLAQFGILAAGLLIACLFLGLLAQALRDEAFELEAVLRRLPLHWAHLAAVLAPFGLFFIFAFSIAFLFGPLAVFVLVGLIWLLIYTAFFPQAVVLSDFKPLRALGATLRIVRTNFWSTLGLLLVVNLLSTGLGLIWARLLVRSTVTAVVAILANAYIGTGLTLSMFIFYRDRLAALSGVPSQPRSA